MFEEEIHLMVPGRPDDPRDPRPDIPGVVVHYVPELHPDDVTVVDGIPVTTVARTLIDCAEDASVDELRWMFAEAGRRGLLHREELEASLRRVEWRPSLPLVRQMMEEFFD